MTSKGPYFYGGEITSVDLSLAPTLYHLTVALGHFKGWTIPKRLTRVLKYTKLLFDRKSFKNTKPSDNCVIDGWALKLNP
ncbi:glutathione S-transferase DHAR2 [Artemisia annua]|uniref:glutathione transferase n=1 Tax=Artemisia annua TaxID=35608 RepID=A0A2U1NQ16_ARTAN|nr:glutathione S-transferase DHAR2 [Artemisia annua]